jgi:hypothetical protein
MTGEGEGEEGEGEEGGEKNCHMLITSPLNKGGSDKNLLNKLGQSCNCAKFISS